MEKAIVADLEPKFIVEVEGLSFVPCLVTTEYRGVFCGLLSIRHDLRSDEAQLWQARMGIYWCTENGLLELCNVGPNKGSRISDPADCYLKKVSAYMWVTEIAWERWQNPNLRIEREG